MPPHGLILAALMLCSAAAMRPNILFILTDDQDVVMGSSERDIMPKMHALIADNGVRFENTFATTPVCCPSRSSLVTGRYLHNIPMTNNSIAGNCSSPAFQNGAEKQNIGKLMHDVGYSTFYSGKYLNTYGFPEAGGVAHVPPGWDSWATLVGNSRYYNYSMSINGTGVKHGGNYHNDYFTDKVANYTLDFIRNSPRDKPFFAIAATPSCHDPTEAAPQYAELFEGRKAPRLPNYGLGSPPFSADRNWFVKEYGGLGMPEDRQAVSDWQYRRRLETLQSVDDFVANAVEALKEIDQLDNTYIIYTSDHGYHFGLLGLLKDKRMPYEFDIRVPGFVRGPGVPKGGNFSNVLTMIDFAPTFMDIAGAAPPTSLDGTSALPHFLNPTKSASRSFFVEYFGEAGKSPGAVCADQWTEGVSSYIEGPEMTKTPPVFQGTTVCSTQDSTNNTYGCVRTMNATHNDMYCVYTLEDNAPFREYYDLESDFFQRRNNYTSLSPDAAAAYEAMWSQLHTCEGEQCVISY